MSRDDFQRETFEKMLEGGSLPLSSLPRLAGTALLDPFRLLITHMPGPLGYGIRRFLYQLSLGSVGKSCLFDVGLRVVGHDAIHVGEYTWLDAYCSLNAMFGPLRIGKRVHMAPGVIVHAGEEGIEIGDYVAIGANTQIWGHSEVAKDGKRMSGPMIPWRYKAYGSAQVVISKDAFLGAGSIILPGITVGEGAVVGAGSIPTRDVPPWRIVFGAPARVVGKRAPVTVPDL